MAGELPLRGPELAVDVEDSETEEVAEDVGEGFALGEVVEVGLEDVLNVGLVGGYNRPGRAEAVNDNGLGTRRGNEVGVPVKQTVAVSVEGDKAFDLGVVCQREE